MKHCLLALPLMLGSVSGCALFREGAIDMEAVRVEVANWRATIDDLAKLYADTNPGLAASLGEVSAQLTVLEGQITTDAIDTLLNITESVQWSSDPDVQTHIQVAIVLLRAGLRDLRSRL